MNKTIQILSSAVALGSDCDILGVIRALARNGNDIAIEWLSRPKRMSESGAFAAPAFRTRSFTVNGAPREIVELHYNTCAGPITNEGVTLSDLRSDAKDVERACMDNPNITKALEHCSQYCDHHGIGSVRKHQLCRDRTKKIERYCLMKTGYLEKELVRIGGYGYTQISQIPKSFNEPVRVRKVSVDDGYLTFGAYIVKRIPTQNIKRVAELIIADAAGEVTTVWPGDHGPEWEQSSIGELDSDLRLYVHQSQWFGGGFIKTEALGILLGLTRHEAIMSKLGYYTERSRAVYTKFAEENVT